jgi:MerR family transcriptional regulator, light-induced transcriptional regulator
MTEDRDRRRRIAEALRAQRDEIASRVTEEFLDRHPDWVDRYGDRAWERGREDAAFHIDFLAGAVLANDASAFADYARWTGGMLGARGIAPEFLAENLEQIGRAAAHDLDEGSHQVLDSLVRAGIAAIGSERPPGEDMLGGGEAYATERSLYIQAIRGGERRAALAVALEAVRAGASVPDVYVEILQPAQYEIGRLWERNEITVANEHMATAITQYVVAQLYSQLQVPERTRGNALVTGVRGELHQLGANMVADVLEADGWRIRFLGTQLPHEGVLQAIEEHEPGLVGISTTVLSNLPAVAELIEEARRRFGSAIAVLVGGGAYRANPEAWRELGADGFARDLKDAVAVAAALGGEAGG